MHESLTRLSSLQFQGHLVEVASLRSPQAQSSAPRCQGDGPLRRQQLGCQVQKRRRAAGTKKIAREPEETTPMLRDKQICTGTARAVFFNFFCGPIPLSIFGDAAKHGRPNIRNNLCFCRRVCNNACARVHCQQHSATALQDCHVEILWTQNWCDCAPSDC